MAVAEREPCIVAIDLDRRGTIFAHSAVLRYVDEIKLLVGDNGNQ